MIYISVDIQFKDLIFDTHMKDIFVLVVKRFEVVCTSNLETAHNLMSLGWICSPLIQNRVKAHPCCTAKSHYTSQSEHFESVDFN